MELSFCFYSSTLEDWLINDHTMFKVQLQTVILTCCVWNSLVDVELPLRMRKTKRNEARTPYDKNGTNKILTTDKRYKSYAVHRYLSGRSGQLRFWTNAIHFQYSASHRQKQRLVTVGQCVSWVLCWVL